MKKVFLIVMLLGVVPTTFSAEQDVAEWQSMVAKQLPKEIGDRRVTSALMKPKVGRSFSRTLSFGGLSRALGNTDLQNARRRGKKSQALSGLRGPERAFVSGDIDGRGPAAILRINPVEGKVRYSNRSLEMNHEDPASQLTNEDAISMALELAKIMRFPEVEIGREFTRANPSMIASGGTEGGQLEVKQMETLVTVPRCMQVRDIPRMKCVPVVGSGLRIAFSDPSIASPSHQNHANLRKDALKQPPITWLKANWPDFRLVRTRTLLSRNDVVERVARFLAKQGSPSSIDRLEFVIAYASSEELTGQEGLGLCPDETENSVDDEHRRQRPIAFAPSVLVYAIATEENNIEKRSENFSSGVSVFSVPLVNICS
jgi:hypothetical protein